MPSAHSTAIVAAPAAALWRRLADIGAWPRWLRVPYATDSVTITPDAAIGPGVEFVMKGRLQPRLFARVTEWDEQRRLAFEIYRSEYPSDRLTFGRAVISIELEPLDDGRTRVSARHRLEGKGLLGKIYGVLVMRALISTNVQRIVDSLAEVA